MTQLLISLGITPLLCSLIFLPGSLYLHSHSTYRKASETSYNSVSTPMNQHFPSSIGTIPLMLRYLNWPYTPQTNLSYQKVQMHLLQTLTWTTAICTRHQALRRPSLLILWCIAEAEVAVGRSRHFLLSLVPAHLCCGRNARGQSWSCVWLADSTWTAARRATWVVRQCDGWGRGAEGGCSMKWREPMRYSCLNSRGKQTAWLIVNKI